MLGYLAPNDFYITQKNDLANKITGYSLVFFRSEKCSYCTDVYPAFAQLSNQVQGCTFAMMDIDQEKKRIVDMALMTNNKLTYVPCIMFYVNGVPYSEFHPDEVNPQSNLERLKTFLIEATTEIKSGGKKALKPEAISSHSIGIPGNKKRVCYLTYETAYAK